MVATSNKVSMLHDTLLVQKQCPIARKVLTVSCGQSMADKWQFTLLANF